MAYIYKNTDKISFYCHSNVMNEYKLNYEIYVYGHKKDHRQVVSIIYHSEITLV